MNTLTNPEVSGVATDKKTSLINKFSASCFHTALWTLVFDHDRNFCRLHVLPHKAVPVVLFPKCDFRFRFALRSITLSPYSRPAQRWSLSSLPISKMEQEQIWQPIRSNTWSFTNCFHVRYPVLSPLQLWTWKLLPNLTDKEMEGLEKSSPLPKIAQHLVVCFAPLFFVLFSIGSVKAAVGT